MEYSHNRNKSPVDAVADSFSWKFGSGLAGIFGAPGRVNLIGEHTDYNDGFVMPIALDLCTFAAVGPRRDRKLFLHSENFEESREFDLADLGSGASGHWSDYVRGVAAVLQENAGPLSGANLAIRSQVPIGAGLSSSAALEVATARALLANSGMEMDALEIAQCCQRAEHQYAGMRCGIMDQFVSCFGASGSALLLDCRSLRHELLPIEREFCVVICNSNVKPALAASEYNKRRWDCEQGVKHIRRFKPEIRALRDVSEGELEVYSENLPKVTLRRCKHVITENARVQEAAQALKHGDMAKVGDLMYESHRSLRDLYEVSCGELDFLVDLAEGIEGVYGARMAGGGFGGCTVNLVQAEAVAEFRSRIRESYQRKTGIRSDIYICSIDNVATSRMPCRSDNLGLGAQPYLRN